MLDRATTSAERLRALLLLTNMSKQLLDRISALMDRLTELSLYDPARDAALAWAKQTIFAISDTNTFSAEQQAIAAQLGPEAQRVVEEVSDMADKLLDPGAPESGPDGLALVEDPEGLPVFGADAQVAGLIRARNRGVNLLREGENNEDRLVALLVVVEASDRLISRLTTLAPRLGAVPESDAARQDAVDFAERTLATLQDSFGLIEEQRRLMEQVGDVGDERAVKIATAVLREEVGPGASPVIADEEPAADLEPKPMTNRDAKACPDCAETIKVAARVCRYCGYRFSPAP